MLLYVPISLLATMTCRLHSLPRTSVRLDRRHYNAWYGIGLTYYKQERFQLAEIYYRKALAINPFSPVLMCHVAVVQHATNNSGAALDTLNGAIKISPKYGNRFLFKRTVSFEIRSFR